MARDRAILGLLSGVTTSPRARVLVITLALLGGTAVSVLLYWRACEWQSSAVRAELNERGRECAELLHINVLRSMDVLHSIAALSSIERSKTHAPIAGPQAGEFRTFVLPALARQPELLAIGWIPRVGNADRALFESALRQQNPQNLTLHEQVGESDESRDWKIAGQRSEYFPVYLIEPQGRNAAAIGFDLASERVRAEALTRARDSALPAATPVLHLVQESGDRPGFIVYLPVYSPLSGGPASATSPPDIAQRRQALCGYASAVFCVDDLVRPALEGLVAKGYRARLIDSAEPGRVISAAGFAALPAADPASQIGSLTELNFAGRTWQLKIEPTPTLVAKLSTAGRQPRATLFGGLSITLLLTAYLASAARAAGRVERRVLERTAEISREIAERKRAEEAARAAEAKYRSIFENSVEGLFQTTPQGQYISANRALANVYGYQSIEHLIADLTNIAAELYVNAGRRDEFIGQVQRDGAVWGFESEVRRRDGKIIWISENARAVYDATRCVLYYEGSVLDITARKRSEELLRHDRDHFELLVRDRTVELARTNEALRLEVGVRRSAEAAAAAASDAKSDFLSRMSHEIRTPMNAILGYAQLLARDPSLAPRHQDVIRTVVGSGNHLIGLLNDVLDLAKIEAGHAEVRAAAFDLTSLVHDVAAIVRGRCSDKGLRLRIELDDALNAAHRRVVRVGDERKLRQVLINLLANAVTFTDIGDVTLRVAKATENDRIVFEVIDTGIGIDADRQAEIFEPFRQASSSDRGGTGLGLAIARQHVAMMGGVLRLTSEPGKGTCVGFTLSLPEAEPSPSLAASDGHGHKPLRLPLAPGLTVQAMVVDDVRENCDVLAGMLSLMGCTVTVTGSGQKALDLAASEEHFDLIFIDLLMPGMSGTQAGRRLRALDGAAAASRLIATSASVPSHEREGFRDTVFDDFLLKPMQFEEVYGCVCRAINVSPESTPAPRRTDRQPADARPSLESLPQPIRIALAEAAEMCRVTEMKQLIDSISVSDLSKPNDSAAGAQEFLRGCLRRYDMDAIRDALAEVNCA